MQYYRLPDGTIYALNKATGAAQKVSSVPLGGAVITWNDSNSLPPDLNSALSGTYQSPSNSAISTVEQQINDVIGAVISSGKTINPGLTPEDLAAIDPAKFLSEAEKMIAPEYQQKFSVAKDSLSRTLSELGYDLGLKKTNIEKKVDYAKRTGIEDLAGRGLAFSSNREMFESDLNEEKDAALKDADVSAYRLAQDASTRAEGLLGTQGVQSLNPGQIGGRSLSFSSTPLVGSLNTDKAYTAESISKELANQEAQRRAYTTRNLSFS